MEKDIQNKNQPVSQNFQEKHTQSQMFNSILQFLKEKNIPYKLMQHQSAQTSLQSSKIRNTPLQWGSKTMLVRTGKPKQLKENEVNNQRQDIWMLLYRANHKLSWNKIRKIQEFGKKCKMLTEQELFNIFQLKPGGVPPFANLLKIKGIVDSKFQLQKTMAFNAGLRDKSLIMSTSDFCLQYFKCVSITQDDKKQEEKPLAEQKQN